MACRRGLTWDHQPTKGTEAGPQPIEGLEVDLPGMEVIQPIILYYMQMGPASGVTNSHLT